MSLNSLSSQSVCLDLQKRKQPTHPNPENERMTPKKREHIKRKFHSSEPTIDFHGNMLVFRGEVNLGNLL